MKAPDFTFCLFPDDGQGVAILMDTADDDHGDNHLSEMVEPFWPVEFEMDEVCEGTFMVNEDLTEEQVKALLIKAGFTFSQTWQDQVDSE